MRQFAAKRFPALIAVAALALACGEAPDSPLAPAGPALSELATNPVECPVSTTSSTNGTIDLLGGTLELDGHSMTVPAGALLLPTTFTLTVPASNYMEIAIHAEGVESFQFEAPVSIVISYQRCTRSNINGTALTAWYWDSATGTLLEHMGGVDDKSARTVTFDSGHLSGFVIAN